MAQHNNIRKRIAAWMCLLLLVPECILMVLFPKAFYIASVLILFSAMLPFFLLFEAKRPRAREITLLAVLSALAVAGRAAFFMLPQMKPMAAITILSGAVFGPLSGFIVGSVSCFVSNFIFGQGPYTPFQMMGFGLIGVLAGVLFAKNRFPQKRWMLCLYGGVSVMVIYAPLVNFSSVLFVGTQSLEKMIAVFLAGISFDLLHAGATVAFLFFLANPMIRKLERVKLRYGIDKENQY